MEMSDDQIEQMLKKLAAKGISLNASLDDLREVIGEL